MVCIASGDGVLHLERSDRCLLHQRWETKTVQVLSAIYTTFSAHVRYFRKQCYDQDKRFRLVKVLDQLATQGSSGEISKVEDRCCGYGTIKLKCMRNSDPSPSWLTTFILVWRTHVSKTRYSWTILQLLYHFYAGQSPIGVLWGYCNAELWTRRHIVVSHSYHDTLIPFIFIIQDNLGI